jgi:hypothetical protein
MSELNKQIEATIDNIMIMADGGDIIPMSVAEPFDVHFANGDLSFPETTGSSHIASISEEANTDVKPLADNAATEGLDQEKEDEVQVFGSILILDSQDETNERILHISGVDFETLRETLQIHIGALTAAAYMHGRSDQIADFVGNNSPRFVRERELHSVLKRALGSDSGVVMYDTKAWLKAFKKLRGTAQKI